MNLSPRKRAGFTLIELLLVISIISLLSSIVIASTSRARAKAVDAKTISETRQARTALAVYDSTNSGYPVCDSSGSFPQSCCLGSNSCKLAGVNITTKLENAGIPDFGENLPVYTDGSGYEYQGYVYTCSTSEIVSGQVICPEENISIIYSTSEGTFSMDSTGRTTAQNLNNGDGGTNSTVCYFDSDCQSGQWCNNFDITNPNRYETAGVCTEVTAGTACNMWVNSTNCGNTSFVCTQDSQSFAYTCVDPNTPPPPGEIRCVPQFNCTTFDQMDCNSSNPICGWRNNPECSGPEICQQLYSESYNCPSSQGCTFIENGACYTNESFLTFCAQYNNEESCTPYTAPNCVWNYNYTK